MPAIAEMLRVGRRDLRSAQALERGDVARRDDDDALFPALRAERVLEELADLATALADERDDDDVGFHAARDRAEQRALADAGAREQTDALSFAEREEPVEHAHARRDRAVDGATRERVGRIAIDEHDVAFVRLRSAVDRAAEPVDDATEERVRRAHREGSSRRFDEVVRSDARERAEWHRDRFARVESDDLAREWLAAPLHVNDVADANAGHRETQRQTRHAEHAPGGTSRRCCSETCAERVEIHARASSVSSIAMTESSPAQRTVGLAAAWLLLIALLTGIYAAAAMSGKLHVDGHAALASHLNALMGTFLLGTVGWTMPMLSYGETGKKRLAIVLVVSSFANWIITAVKAALFVAGIDVQGKAANDGVFVALQIFVVVPMIAAAIAWIVGFRRRT